MKKDIKKYLSTYTPKKSSLITRIMLPFIAKGLKGRKQKVIFTFKINKKEYRKKQFIIIADHSSRDNYLYFLNAYKLPKLNFIVGYENFYAPFLLWALTHHGCVPKRLYGNDFKAVKDIIRLKNQGCSFYLAPEGIQSSHGATHPINPATVKLLKTLGIEVLLIKSYGAYLTKSRYNYDKREGKQYYEISSLFSADEINSLNEDEIYTKLLENFKYDDFEWNKIAREKYIGKTSNAHKLENILYYCPFCHSEFMTTSIDDKLVCENCHQEVKVNEYYDLVNPNLNEKFATISKWYNQQRYLVREEVKDPNFKIEFDANLKELRNDKTVKEPLMIVGQGHVTINHEGVKYEGTRNNEPFNKLFSLIQLPSIPFTPGQDLDIYYNNDFFVLNPIKDSKKVVKYMLCVEEMHNQIDPAWDKASRDVYD